MEFSLRSTIFFIKQWENLGESSKNLINNKLSLIKQNPFRFPKHEGYNFVFKVKLNIGNNYSRLMYVVFMPDSKSVTILGIFDRKAEYKDFEKIFKDYRKP